ncbi:MAG: hypothetical protein ACOC1G_00195 [Phycisphaeraceae bacterium]
MVEHTFPDDDSLCEACGYRLHGVAGDACPECGEAVAASSPDLRTGLPWQHAWGAISFLHTASTMVRSPGEAFRRMSLSDTGWNARLFLLMCACLSGAVWLVIDLAWAGRSVFWSWGVAMAVVKSVILLTYVEVLGLSFFSRRRGWRVSLDRAERLGGYASVAWPAAAAVLASIHALEQRGVLAGAWERWIGMWSFSAKLGVLVAAAGVAMLWFEWLCWLGAQRIRYANAPPAG